MLSNYRTYLVTISRSFPFDCKFRRALTADCVEESPEAPGVSYSTHWLPPSSAERIILNVYGDPFILQLLFILVNIQLTSLLFTVSSSGILSVHVLLQTVDKYALLMLMVSCCNTGCEITSAEAGARLVVTSSSFTSIVIPSPSPPSMKSCESYSKHRDRVILWSFLMNFSQRVLHKTTDKVKFIHQLIFTHSLN